MRRTSAGGEPCGTVRAWFLKGSFARPEGTLHSSRLMGLLVGVAARLLSFWVNHSSTNTAACCSSFRSLGVKARLRSLSRSTRARERSPLRPGGVEHLLVVEAAFWLGHRNCMGVFVHADRPVAQPLAEAARGVARRLVRKRCLALNGLPPRRPVLTNSTIQLVPTHSSRMCSGASFARSVQVMSRPRTSPGLPQMRGSILA